jgi:hypothetical protein
MSRVVVRTPAASGVKIREMVQVALGASGPAQVFELIEKSALLSPLRVTVENWRVAEPELVAMMD